MNDHWARQLQGPPPPSEVDRAVLGAAGREAAKLASVGLSQPGKMSYSEKSNEVERGEPAMSDNIVFPCPACGTKYSVSPAHAGKKTACKKCGAAITVPSPEVANPTLVGQTRTIRRADIERAGGGTRKVTNPGAPAVDMDGGASVLRKPETVAAPAAPSTRRPGVATRPPLPGRASRRTTAVPTAAPGRPMPPGHPPHGFAPPARKKKDNLPLIFGIAGGVVVLTLVVVLIVVASSGPKTTPSTVAKDDQTQPQPDPQAQADLRLLNQMQAAYANRNVMAASQVKLLYEQAKERSETNPDFEVQRDLWATQLSQKMKEASALEQADIAVLLADDEFPTAKALLEEARDAMIAGNVAVQRRPGEGRATIREAHPKFREIAERLGWKEYTRDPLLDEYEIYAIDGYSDYNQYYIRLNEDYRDMRLYPPDVHEELRRLEEIVLINGKAFIEQHEKDGFAKNARAAWIRFRIANDGRGAVNRAKGRRQFSPLAMGRENETFDQIWTYTYWDPFIVYVEKPPGADTGRVAARFQEALGSKSSLLQHLYEWFEQYFIKSMNLERVKPIGMADLAAKEGWPLDIFVLQNEAAFLKYVEDVNGSPMPGARAFYSPVHSHVITYDDQDGDDDSMWFNESVLIHETFHLLSDHFAAEPINYEQLERDEQRPNRPRYSSILVQEGITDAIAGFKRGGGEGRDATYEFLHLNHLRLRSWQTIYGWLNNQSLFRIQDMLESGSYTALHYVGARRLGEIDREGIDPRRLFQTQMNLMGLYYAAACQANYFFHHYREGGNYPYRDKWWEFLKRDYTGKLVLTSFDTDPATKVFKEIFGINSDADWEALNRKFVEYTAKLTPENVGSGYELEEAEEENGDSQESVLPFRHFERKYAVQGSMARRED